MNDIGHLLALLHGAFDRFETCRATIREWHDPRLTEEAMRRWTSRRPGLLAGPGRSACPLAKALTAEEQQRFEAHLRPLVEQGRGSWRGVNCYAVAVK